MVRTDPNRGKVIRTWEIICFKRKGRNRRDNWVGKILCDLRECGEVLKRPTRATAANLCFRGMAPRGSEGSSFRAVASVNSNALVMRELRHTREDKTSTVIDLTQMLVNTLD